MRKQEDKDKKQKRGNNDMTEGRGDRIRQYAMGKQDLAKYKLYMNRNSELTYVNIDWPISKIVRRLRNKILAKFRQSIKNYQMIFRLRKLTTP